MPSLIIILLILFSFSSTIAYASTWERTYGGTGNESGFGSQQTSDGGYIIAGETDSSGSGMSDVYLLKTDSNGNILWEKTYGGPNIDQAMGVQETSDNGNIIVGQTRSYGAGGWDVYLIKTDTNGNALWTKTYGGTGDDWGNSVQQTSDGGFIIGGKTNSIGAGNYDVYLIRTDSNGNVLWTKTYGGTDEDGAYTVRQTSDGGFIMSGARDVWTNCRIYLIKTDANGNVTWERTYGGGYWAWGGDIQQTPDGGYIHGGVIFSNAANIYLGKIDGNGNTIWERSFGGTNGEYGGSVQRTPDGGYVVSGFTASFGAGGVDVYLVKVDANGNELWEKTYGGTGDDYGSTVQQTSDGGYILSGRTNSFGAGNYDVYLIKTDANGNISSIELPRTGQTTCYDTAVAVIACAGTGQDGEIQAGVPWPSPRFTDNGDATVTDNLTGLMWTKDGNAPGPGACSPATTKNWQGALDYVACLNANNYLGHTDWRLPNINELRSMVHAGQSNTSTWLNSQGFNNVQSNYYWSSTTNANGTGYAWIVSMWNGSVYNFSESNNYYYVWPVRSGQSGSLDNSILLSQATGDQQSQTVAWNDVDNEYIALWQDFRNGTGNPDIYGARLDIDGNVIATDLPIVTQTAKQAGPWVSYGGGGYIAVWIDQRNMSTTGTDVYGAWILPDGTVSSEFVVTNATANQRAASVVYNPSANNFLVTWIDDTSGTSDLNIGGAVVSPGGGVSSGPFAMITASGNQRGPYARYDYGNSQYFMVWFDNSGGDYDIYGSRVSSSGIMLDGSGLVISNATGDQKNGRLTERRPADGVSNFVLSWIDFRNGQADIYGALIDGLGTKIGSDIQIAGGSYDQRAASIDVDYIRTGQAVVSWIDNRNGTDYDIYRAQVDQSGIVSGEALVAGAATGAANNQQGPTVKTPV